jgi:hypothetical protein
MNTNAKSAPRRPGGLWGIGTTGWLFCLHFYIWELARGLANQSGSGGRGGSARTLLALETAQGSKQMTARFGPGHPSVRLPDESGFVLPPRSVRDLADECLRHRHTRGYGEKLARLPDALTDDGVGAVPLVALANGLACKPQIDQLIEGRILAQRERNRIDSHHDCGETFSLASRNTQIIGGNYGGGTYPGLALFVAERIQHYSVKYLGNTSDIILFGTTPSALSGGDVVAAQGNFATFIRQAVIANKEPRKIVFHTFTEEELRPSSPLVHRIVPWGPSSGKLCIGSREEITAQMALAAAVILDTPYGAFAEAEFRDHDKDALDTRYGTRVFARLGITRWAIDPVRDAAIAEAEGMRLVAENLLNGNVS